MFNEDTGNFRFIYADNTNTITGGEVKVYYVNSTTETFFNSTSALSTSATLLVPVTNVTGRTYRADAYIQIDGVYYFVDSIYFQYKPETLTADKSGLFYVVILCILFATLAFWDISIAVVLTPLPLVFASLLGFIEIPLYATLPIQILAIIIAYIISRR
jgi:hypothetical protein